MSNGVGTRTLMDGNQPSVSKAREAGLAFPSTSLTRRQRRWGRPRRAAQRCSIVYATTRGVGLHMTMALEIL
ncbi:hypothetical protein N7466_001639 [Penicillium verhagenii]|uniref:uncharacterized protein n=1 Tax=Penicillium verhagenii TaxID=1562060 RepID=UPI002544F18C|nr:uncharacterized protein N7466_001639 [Penicillium verhagenii]KAJ5938505.1 hypothetical protein N7466_001639 [Penicillium verhagenii]